MKLFPVESSMLAKVGYDPQTHVIRAVMKDGATYDVAASDNEFALFMVAPSMGSCWHKIFAARATKSTETEQAPALHLKEPAKADGVLDVFQAQGCCQRQLAKAARAGTLASVTSFECHECGTDWKRTDQGPLRNWTPEAPILIFGGRKQ